MWYCEELKTTIDFDQIMKSNDSCVKVYQENGNIQELGCPSDFSLWIYFYCTVGEDEVDYLNGELNGTFK